jgi:hypothetical protein
MSIPPNAQRALPLPPPAAHLVSRELIAEPEGGIVVRRKALDSPEVAHGNKKRIVRHALSPVREGKCALRRVVPPKR